MISRDHRRSVTAPIGGPCYDTGADRMNSCSDLSGHLTDHSSGKSSTDEDMYGDNSAMALQQGGHSLAEKSREAMCSPNAVGMMAAGSSGVLNSTDAAEIEAEKVLGKI